jgi:hypothetical protein
MRWKQLGVAAAIGLIVCFASTILSHVLVGGFAGLGGAALMLVLAVILMLRVKARPRVALPL